ncbi:MAG: Nitrogen regulation protein [Pseudomonadota bacterium]
MRHFDRLTARLKPSGSARWLFALGSLSLAALGVGLLVLLTQATGNRERYNQNFEWLLLVNAVVALGLGLTIALGVVRLVLRWRRGQFGARLLFKLAAIFGLVGIVPGLLIYVVSYQFVSRSIESWFDVQVEGALTAGLDLGRSTIDTLSMDLGKQARAAASQVAQEPASLAGLTLERVREQLGLSDAVLWTASGRLIAGAGQSRFALRAVMPSPQQQREARANGMLVWSEGLEEGAEVGRGARLRALVWVPQMRLSLDEEAQLLMLTQELPPTLVANALQVQVVNREYQERALARDGLRRMYIATLTLTLFMAVLGAILLAVLLGNQLARPLLVLAHGMRQVAAGDLTPKLTLSGRDELGGLTRSFADMTQQLSDARSAALRNLQQLEAARGSLQTILDNLTAGVMVLDAQGIIRSANPGATRILRVPVAAHEGQALASLPGLADWAQKVQAEFDQLVAGRIAHDADHWQQAFDIHASGQGLQETKVTLLARGAPLPEGSRLLVFDDISEIVSAQRAQAWGEVARRLAHEIKNPLTPIQLSAERLQLKLAPHLQATEAAILVKSVRTIVDQVDAMKRLVNEFRDYARLPTADLVPLDLNALVGDVMGLYAQDQPLTQRDGEMLLAARVPVRVQLDPACPFIRGDAQQLRQVVHNLLQNAQDACEMPPAGEAVPREGAPCVWLRTEWQPQRQRVRLTISDSGPGFAPHILQRAFEPYVTTKAKGTGLGLAVVKKIIDEHGARIELSNLLDGDQVRGAQVSLSFTAVPQAIA